MPPRCRAELAIKLYGDDLHELAARARDVTGVVDGVRGAADVQVDQISGAPQLVLRVDRSPSLGTV